MPPSALAIAASYAGDPGDAVQLARQAGADPGHPPPGRPGLRFACWPRSWPRRGTWPPPRQACAATLAQARDAGDLYALGMLLPVMADLDVRAGRPGDAAARLREAAQIALQTGS